MSIIDFFIIIFILLLFIVFLLFVMFYKQSSIESEIKTLQLMIDECTDEIIKEMGLK